MNIFKSILFFGWNSCSWLFCHTMNWILHIYFFEDPHRAKMLYLVIQESITGKKSGSKRIFNCYTIKKNAYLVHLPKLLKAAVFHKCDLPLTRNSPYFTNSNNIPTAKHPLILQMKTPFFFN